MNFSFRKAADLPKAKAAAAERDGLRAGLSFFHLLFVHFSFLLIKICSVEMIYGCRATQSETPLESSPQACCEAATNRASPAVKSVIPFVNGVTPVYC